MKIWTKRILLFLICMGVAGCLAVVWLSAYVKSETAARILSAEEAAKQDADCILVLGCGVRPDGTPSLYVRQTLLARKYVRIRIYVFPSLWSMSLPWKCHWMRFVLF